MSIIDIAYALTTPVEAVTSLMMFDAFCEKRKKFAIWQYVVGIVVLTVLLKLSNTYFLFTLENVISIVLAVFVVSLYYYQAPLRKSLFLSVFIWSLWCLIEMLTLHSITLIFGITASEAVNISSYAVLGVIISKSVQFALAYIVYIKGVFHQIELGKLYWVIFLILFFSATCTSYMIFWMLNQINDPGYNLMAMFCTVSLYIGTFLTFYLYARSQHQHQIIRDQEKAEQQMRSQMKHMDEVILKQNELRALRHDMNSHLIALDSFFDAGDLSGGRKYLSNLIAQFENVTSFINTGNNALDAIINAKRSLAKSKGIAFKNKIMIQENLPIAPEDLVIIFGNALDNAIEACERLTNDENKWITLILQQDARTIFCKIANAAPKKANNDFATSKDDKINHGFGLKNMQEALEKYHALVTYEQKDTQFIFSFAIFY